MPGNLNVDAELKKPVTVEKDCNDEDTKRLKKVKSIPKDEGMWSFELPFDECAHAIIDGEPKT